MPRVLALGNGRILVNFDEQLNMRDLFYPRVGMNNHILGHFNRLGVWSDGWFDWVSSPEWERRSGYEDGSLIGYSTAVHTKQALSLLIEDAVDFRKNIFIKKVRVVNGRSASREVRVFFTHDFCVDESDIGDTSLYDPGSDALLHYKRDKWFLMSGTTGSEGIFQYANGTKRFHGAEGTWRDAEDGVLEGNAIAQGSVDSCMSFRLIVPPEGEKALTYWIACGKHLDEVRHLNRRVRRVGVDAMMEETRTYWRSWVGKKQLEPTDLSDEAVSLFRRSLLIVRTQIDRGGGILAANDSDILHFNRDDYSYVWPRDGAFIAAAMCAAGYPELVRGFFRFCARGLSSGGFLWHKYHPDGSLGSSWHPWVENGDPLLPIQEDETALVVYALWKLYEADNDIDFIESLYATFVRPAADFMAGYRDRTTGLPLESHDLWEERRGVFTFTAAAVWAGLDAAARFASLFGDDANREKYVEAAQEVRNAIVRYLFREDLGRFIRSVRFVSSTNGTGKLSADTTLESSVAAVYSLGMLPADDPMVVSTMKQIEEGLAVNTTVGGFARYENDWYFRADARVPGNPWIICTLWIADWHIAHGRLQRARELIEWSVTKAGPSGVLPEQLHPMTGQPLSVSPLTWSHSTFVHTVLKYTEAWNNTSGAGAPGEPVGANVGGTAAGASFVSNVTSPM